uniref:Uncharacterized protein n=1 Tax=Romanomermis culicivorax TaxID=13658 RepID=A0A915HIZ1_ROMCU
MLKAFFYEETKNIDIIPKIPYGQKCQAPEIFKSEGKSIEKISQISRRQFLRLVNINLAAEVHKR